MGQEKRIHPHRLKSSNHKVQHIVKTKKKNREEDNTMTTVKLEDIKVSKALMRLLENVSIVGGDITEIDEEHARKIIALVVKDGLIEEDVNDAIIQFITKTGGIDLDYFPDVDSCVDIAKRVIENDTNNKEEGSSSYIIGSLPKSYIPFINVDLVAEAIAKNKMYVFVPKWRAAIRFWS